MANPIQKNDLITDGALEALTTMSTTLSTIAENLTKAKAACQGWGEEEKKTAAATGDNVEELSKMSARITQLEDAIKKLNAAEKENENARRSVNEQKRLYRKLTDDEIKSVEDLKRALAGSVEEQMAAVKAIDTEKKSYNELNQTYNALKDTLNKLTTEQRNNTEAGRAMTASALKIRDTMNELQKATGNYTLQVGKYKAAFDGLGFSFMQILREAPSALNLNQFFLAISNNLPLFFDQVTAYTKSMKTELAQLQTVTNKTAEETARMAELTEITGNKVKTFTAVVKRLGTAMFSLQGAVLAFTLILRFLPKIIDWVKSLFNNVQELVGYLKREVATAKILSGIVSDVTRTRVELEQIVAMLPSLKQGTDEYANAMARVKELTGGMVSDLNEAPDKVAELTKAFIEQAEQLAKNKYVIDQITKSAENSAIRQIARTRPSFEAMASTLELDEDSDEYKKLQTLYNATTETGPKRVWKQYRDAANNLSVRLVKETEHDVSVRLNDAQKALGKYIDELRPVYTSEDIKAMWDEWYVPLPAKEDDGPKRPKVKKPTEQSITERYWEAERALLNAMEEGVQKEIEISDWERRKNKDEQDKWYAEQLAALEENVKNGFTTREQADKEALELQRQYNALQEDEDRQHNERVVKIQMDAYRKQLAIREELHKNEMQAIVETSKADTVHVQRRVRNATQEANKNAALATNIEHLVEARKKLLAVEIAMDENKSIEERIKLLEQLNKQIERYASQISITQKIRQYGSVSDMLGTFIGGRVGGQGKENLISNILGEDAMKARIAGFQADNPDGWEKDYMDWLDGEFEEWGKQAMNAASTWYSTTMGYINDLISAYVELANAKAEAAAEATEAAQEEYDKEKALLEAGYASRVEATWAEYQEKKAAQEKAEADAKAAAQAQQQLNEAEAMGSLIVASANIWKTFSAIKGFGVPLALAALATMWGSFIQAKVKAAEVSKYGEGGFEVLEGGSHASGHDIDLGVKNRKGRRMRAEGKEGLGIFSRKAMAHYGANNIEAMVNSVNRLEFEGNAAKRMSLERSVGMAVLSAPRTDLRRLENSVDKLVGYGSRNVTVLPDGTVREIRKNGVVTIKKG